MPESDHARNNIARKFNANPDSTFSLLRAIGRDCAGAVSLYPSDDLPKISSRFQKLEATEISEKALARNIRDLHNAPLFSNIRGLRLSLAGVQDKAAVCLINGAICIPEPGVPSTHILKAAIPERQAIAQNEYLCMATALRMGLPAVKVEIRTAEDQTFLLVERFDRETTVQCQISRVHQEDFCQALGFVSSRKYQADGGPGFSQCFDLLMNVERPALDRTLLSKYLIFNYLIGNADAHGKNFSLLHCEPHETRLAPLYDILSIPVYEDLDQNMAMSIGGTYNARAVGPEHWSTLCTEIGFGFPAFKKELSRHTEDLIAAAEAERKLLKEGAFDTWVADEIIRIIQSNCNRVQESFGW